MHGWNNMLHNIVLLIIFFILIFGFFYIFFDFDICRAKNGNELFVGGTGIGNYTSIQDAIDNANDDDTVYVYNGIYSEELVIDVSINLIGSDKNSTIIWSNRSLYVILIKSSGVNITGFTIQNGKTGIYIPESNYSFNNIYGNILTYNWEGIRLYNTSNNKIYGNIISDNSNYGIVTYESNNNIIKENFFNDSSNSLFFGRWSDNNIISKNNFTGNYFSIILEYSFNNLIFDNSIIDGNRGIWLSYSKNNIITNNTLEFNDESGIYLSNSDDNIINQNNFSNNYKDIKKAPKPPKIKAPGFGILYVTCAIFVVLFLRKKIF